MSGFSARWLALREPADAAARAPHLPATIAAALRSRSPLRIVDLGCGTGANVRYLSPRLPSPQEWLLVDNDPVLLGVAREAAAGASAAVHVSARLLDLGALDPAVFDGRDLVTASALLDLVSDSWAADVVAHCRRTGACVLAALNYDGRIARTPVDDDDEWIRLLVNRHQRTDKGLGPALGPDAGVRTEALLRDAGFHVVRNKSDWQLGGDHLELQRELIDGWASAACELASAESRRIEAWRLRRQAYVMNGRSELRVGHDDVAAVPRREPVSLR